MMYISNCGKYIAILQSNGYDVIAVDGSCIWLQSRYNPEGFDDNDPRYLYPEFPHMVTFYKSVDRKKVKGKMIDIFELGFSDHDTSKKVKPYSGNTVTKSYSARFEKVIKKLAR